MRFPVAVPFVLLFARSAFGKKPREEDFLEAIEIIADPVNQVNAGDVTRHLQSKAYDKEPETAFPTTEASASPTASSSVLPTASATTSPTASPTASPTTSPTASPTSSPTFVPSDAPSYGPTETEQIINESFLSGPTKSGSATEAAVEFLQSDGPQFVMGGVGEGPNLVFGGTNAAIGQFPYFVDLDSCGGTLIHPRVVLTAAHCNDGFPPANSFIGETLRVGALAFDPSVPDGSIPALVIDQINHPRYFNVIPPGEPPTSTDTLGLQNDFALLLLATEVTIAAEPELRLSRNPEDISDGLDLVAIGLGGSTDTDPPIPPSILQQTVIQANSDNWCKQVFPEQSFCAGVNAAFNQATNICSGDSGGPLLRAVGNIHYQVGVTSWGPSPCDGMEPQVYAQIPGNEEGFGWIHETVCEVWGFNATFCGGNECESDCDCNEGYECGCLDGESSKKSKSSSDDGRFLHGFAEPQLSYSSMLESSKPKDNWRKDRRRVESKSSSGGKGSGKGSKGCKSVKGCKGGQGPFCLDNGDLSGDTADDINDQIL